MGTFRLYKKFYHFGTNNSQVLFNPISLSAATYVSGSGGTESSTLIESSISIYEEELGIFYANMNPGLYASDITYDIIFYVKYTMDAPIKKIISRFRIQPNNVANQLDYEILNNVPIDYEIIGTYN